MQDDLTLIIERRYRVDGGRQSSTWKWSLPRSGQVNQSPDTGRYYCRLLTGSPTPLNQVANVSVADARTLTIQPWEKNAITAY